MPPGLSLSGNTVSGTPTQPGSYSFTLQIADAAATPAIASKNLGITIDATGTSLAVSSSTLANGSYGGTYSEQLQAIGGTAPYTWSIASGTLPPGLAISGNTISGTPTQAGSFSFTLQVTDGAAVPVAASREFSITIDKVLLSVTATSITKPPGFANPAFTATYSGFVNGDDASVISGAPSFDCPATVSSPVGSYGIIVSQGSLTAANYRFAFVNGTLNIAELGTDSAGRTIAPVSLAASSDARLDIDAGTLMTDASGKPITGALTLSTTSYGAGSAPPPSVNSRRTANGNALVSLGASIDLALSSGGLSVKTITPPMRVTLTIPASYAAPGTTVEYYSFDGSKWQKEGTATVNADGTVEMLVGHLSIWAVAKFQLPSGKIVPNDTTTAITINDALRALRIAVGMITPTESDLANGDVAPLVNGSPAPNNKINVGDAIVILQKSLGIVGW